MTEPDAETSGEIHKIREENGQLRQDVERKVRRGGYFWLIMVLTSVLAGGGGFGLSAWNTRQSEKKLCRLVTLTDDNFRANPPSSIVLKRQAEAFRQLRRDYGCPPFEEDRKP